MVRDIGSDSGNDVSAEATLEAGNDAVSAVSDDAARAVDNEVLAQLRARKSVRAFTDEPVSEEVRAAILDAAFQAPTAGNQQLYSVIDVRDPAIKERLAELCDHQPFIATAPMVLVFVADGERWRAAYREAGCEPRDPGPGDLLLSCSDANIAAQNAVVAAWSLGVGSCYIGDVLERCEEMRALLSLPMFAMPAAMLVLGYPTAQQLGRTKPVRMPAEVVVMRDGYHPVGAEQVRAALATRVGPKGFEGWVRAFHDRKYASAFAAEMNRSVATYLEAFGGWDGVGVDGAAGVDEPGSGADGAVARGANAEDGVGA